MPDRTNCPHCGANWIGEPIPEAIRESYGGKTHFKREIGIEVPGVYDGVLFWECPDCNHATHRWPEGSWQYERAIPFVRRVARAEGT